MVVSSEEKRVSLIRDDGGSSGRRGSTKGDECNGRPTGSPYHRHGQSILLTVNIKSHQITLMQYLFAVKMKDFILKTVTSVNVIRCYSQETMNTKFKEDRSKIELCLI